MNIKKNLFSSSLRKSMHNRELLVSSFLLFNALTWYYMLRIVVESFVEGQANAVFYGVLGLAVILSGVLGTFIVRKIHRSGVFLAWSALGVYASVSTFWPAMTSNITLLAFVFGFSFGFGLPSSLSYFADCVTFENRGRSAGILFALTSLLVFLYVFVVGESLLVAAIAASFWRIIGLCAVLMIKPDQTERNQRKPVTFKSVRTSRSFLLFFLPWLMFLLVDSLEGPYTTALTSELQGVLGLTTFRDFDTVFEPLIGVVSALVAGFVADRFGRKRVVISGFIALGITFATLSLPSPFFNEAFWYVASGINGIAWGTFYVMFLLVIWGDLSPENTMREMYFLVGGIPLFLADFLGAVISPSMGEVTMDIRYAAFPIASFFLFLAVFPLMYAPESLPEKKIRDRELKSYFEQAKKVKDKHDQK